MNAIIPRSSRFTQKNGYMWALSLAIVSISISIAIGDGTETWSNVNIVCPWVSLWQVSRCIKGKLHGQLGPQPSGPLRVSRGFAVLVVSLLIWRIRGKNSRRFMWISQILWCINPFIYFLMCALSIYCNTLSIYHPIHKLIDKHKTSLKL